MDQIIAALSGLGPWGLVVAALLWLYVKTQKQLSDCECHRVDDAKEFTQTALTLQSQIHSAIERLERLAESSRQRGPR